MFNLAARSRNAYSRNCWRTSENKEEKNACPPLERAFRIVSSCISLGSTHQGFSPRTLFEGESPGEWGVIGKLNSTKRVNELNET